MLSRKVYEAQAAAVIKKHVPKAGRDACYDIATDLANYYAKDNPKFKRSRFLEACGLEEPIRSHGRRLCNGCGHPMFRLNWPAFPCEQAFECDTEDCSVSVIRVRI